MNSGGGSGACVGRKDRECGWFRRGNFGVRSGHTFDDEENRQTGNFDH